MSLFITDFITYLFELKNLPIGKTNKTEKTGTEIQVTTT